MEVAQPLGRTDAESKYSNGHVTTRVVLGREYSRGGGRGRRGGRRSRSARVRRARLDLGVGRRLRGGSFFSSDGSEQKGGGGRGAPGGVGRGPAPGGGWGRGGKNRPAQGGPNPPRLQVPPVRRARAG